jgi:hypothetical protein
MALRGEALSLVGYIDLVVVDTVPLAVLPVGLAFSRVANRLVEGP